MLTFWPLRSRLCTRLLLPAVLLLSACTTATVETADSGFPVEMAERTLATGFRQIADKYIEPLTVEAIAIEGLRGLQAIEPEFAVSRERDFITIKPGAFNTFSFQKPESDDAVAWARATVGTLLEARKSSTELRNADPERLYEAVFDGTFTLLDTFSRYAGAEQAAVNRAKRTGFGGVGIRFDQTVGGFRVTEILADGPASRAGLMTGDLVTHVDGRAIDGWHRSDIRKLIRGEIGTAVEFRIQREGASPFAISVERERIIPHTVETEIRAGIIVATISSFNNQTATELAQQISVRMQARPVPRGIVLDLRNNPGGLLSQAVQVADLFLVHGKILSTRGRHRASLHEYLAQENDISGKLPLIVLMNGRSASASEIVAAALQDHERAVVIGTSSFGKGTVQTVIRLPNDGELTLTWSQFITPSGYVLHQLGVPPFICTGNTRDAPERLIEQAVNHASRIAQTLESWRFGGARDAQTRSNLRAYCPTGNSKGDTDIRIAERLIGDRGLYRRVLAFSPSVAAADR